MTTTETPPNQMSFWEHLHELRVRLIRSLLIVAGAFALTYFFRFRLMTWAQKPFMDTFKQHAIAQAVRNHLPPPTVFDPFAYTSLTEPFFSLMRLAFWAAAFIESTMSVVGGVTEDVAHRLRRNADRLPTLHEHRTSDVSQIVESCGSRSIDEVQPRRYVAEADSTSRHLPLGDDLGVDFLHHLAVGGEQFTVCHRF